MIFNFPSTAVAALYPQGEEFTNDELLEKFKASLDICKDRVLHSQGASMAGEQVKITMRMNVDSILALKEAGKYKVKFVNTQLCQFGKPYGGQSK